MLSKKQFKEIEKLFQRIDELKIRMIALSKANFGKKGYYLIRMPIFDTAVRQITGKIREIEDFDKKSRGLFRSKDRDDLEKELSTIINTHEKIFDEVASNILKDSPGRIALVSDEVASNILKDSPGRIAVVSSEIGEIASDALWEKQELREYLLDKPKKVVKQWFDVVEHELQEVISEASRDFEEKAKNLFENTGMLPDQYEKSIKTAQNDLDEFVRSQRIPADRKVIELEGKIRNLKSNIEKIKSDGGDTSSENQELNSAKNELEGARKISDELAREASQKRNNITKMQALYAPIGSASKIVSDQVQKYKKLKTKKLNIDKNIKIIKDAARAFKAKPTEKSLRAYQDALKNSSILDIMNGFLGGRAIKTRELMSLFQQIQTPATHEKAEQTRAQLKSIIENYKENPDALESDAPKSDAPKSDAPKLISLKKNRDKLESFVESMNQAKEKYMKAEGDYAIRNEILADASVTFKRKPNFKNLTAEVATFKKIRDAAKREFEFHERNYLNQAHDSEKAIQYFKNHPAPAATDNVKLNSSIAPKPPGDHMNGAAMSSVQKSETQADVSQEVKPTSRSL